MGRTWSQPDPSSILIDETHALMDTRTFDGLAEYSASVPSGVYQGKMWKRHDGLYDSTCKPSDRRWLLCWYGESNKGPDWCSTYFREIIVI